MAHTHNEQIRILKVKCSIIFPLLNKNYDKTSNILI